MRIRRLNESTERKYLGVVPYICPVCGEEKDITRKVDESYFEENVEKYIIVDYTCGVCDFTWYSQYDYRGDYETEGGDQIFDGGEISPNLYSAEKIEAKKYNL